MDWPFKAFTLTLITLSLLAVTSANCGFDGCEPTFSNVTYQNFNENYSNLFDNNHNLFFELNSPFKNNMEYKTFEVKAYAPLKKTSSKIDLLESRYVSRFYSNSNTTRFKRPSSRVGCVGVVS